MPEARYSMVKAYRRCPKSYEYKYIQNQQRKKPPAPLLRGTIIHELLDARATSGNPRRTREILAKYATDYKALFKEEQDLYGPDFIGEIRRIYDGYLRTYAEENIEYEGSEEFIATDLGNDLRYTGHLDKRIVTRKDNRRWIMDHKTHKNIPGEDQRFQDYQMLMYVWALNRERPSLRIDGIVWDYIRTKSPRIPEPLIKGGLSQAANIDTDYHTYVGELTRLKINPKPYRKFLEELKKRSHGKFYKRIFLPAPSAAMTESVVADFRATAIMMNGLKVFPRHMTRDCSFCEYFRLCSAELRGLDADYIRKTEYEVKEVGDDNSEEE